MGPSFNDFPHLFTPIDIGPVHLKHRLVASPMVSAHAGTISGEVTDASVAFIGAQGKGGPAMVTIGSTPVDFDRGRDFWGCLSATRDSDIPGLKKLAEEAHKWDCRISAEIMHAGCIAHPGELKGKPALVCSMSEWLRRPADFYEVIDEEGMATVIDHFAKAAGRLRAAGFDMVLIHAGHGNLVSSFLSPLTNKREDQYGGPIENRIKFPLAVCKAVREAVGPDMGIEVRLSHDEHMEGGITHDDVVYFFNQAQEYVDLAHLSGGWIFHPERVNYMEPCYPEDRCLNVAACAEIRPQIGIPVTAVGNIPDIYAAEEIIASGKADVVAMARNMLADMDFAKKCYRGAPETIRPCLHCTECNRRPGAGEYVRCAVNPQAGRETRYGRIWPSEEPRKVMIVGGGPAGMMAAQTCIKRGHDVSLYEKSDRLGGRMHEASQMSYKDYFRRYLDWDIKQTMECGAEIHLNTEVTPELVAEVKPDVLFVALGAEHIELPIEGVYEENCMNISQAELREKPFGNKVVFCGGGTSATECAIDLAQEGHDVTMIDMLPADKLMRDVMMEVRAGLNRRKNEAGVKLIDEAKVLRAADGFVEFERVDGTVERIEADTIVTSFGLRPDNELVDSFRYLVPEVYIVGDCHKVRNIFWANNEAFDIAVEL